MWKIKRRVFVGDTCSIICIYVLEDAFSKCTLLPKVWLVIKYIISKIVSLFLRLNVTFGSNFLKDISLNLLLASKLVR